MTVVTPPWPPPPPPAPSVPPAGPSLLKPPPAPAAPAPKRRRLDAACVYGAVLVIISALIFGLLLDIGPVGDVRHARDRETAYADLRSALAQGTVPVGQTGPDGRLLPLGVPVALLTVPELGLREVVREGTTSGVLENGPGHRRDTPMPGQAGTSVVMARESGFGGPFGTLDQLRPDETFTLITGQGTQVFRVLDVRRAGDPVPSPLAAGKARLVLVTADGPAFAPDGVLQVDADLVGAVRPAPARPLVASQLDQSELPMHGDVSAWVPLVLWGEALLLAAVALTLARVRWGRWQAWTPGVPVLGALGLIVADQVVRLLPNLI
ncbi:sortase [Streptacidiphilus rugosus]|uniref:sortase n=1 Tax=Streptacidiphilus rugosus TaxID=405783 RepID=UPI000690F7B8|nr:sortase [Streptacidiphilus rugosus]